MKWSDMHQIVDKLSRQTSVNNLNKLGISYCAEHLKHTDYRLYLLEKTQQGNILEVVAHGGIIKPTEFEVQLTTQIIETGISQSRIIRKGHCHFYSIDADRRCFALLVVNTESEQASQIIHEVLTTIVTIWNNQLFTLFHFQRDYLTGLFNREYFVDALNTGYFDNFNDSQPSLNHHSFGEQRQPQKISEQHALILIDIAEFDEVVNRFGYSIGDEVLIYLARSIELCFRNSDVYCRYDGDIFGVFLQKISEQNLINVINQCLNKIRTSHFPVVNQINVNIGATFIEEGKLAAEILHYASEALVRAKQSEEYFHLYDPKEDSNARNLKIEIGDIELF